MDLIEEFINRYTKEYDFYDQAGRLAAQELEATLQAAGIRSIVTYRAKSISRLQDKCRQRQESRNCYTSVEDIFDDIVDLTGIRVALYFPAERDQVEGMINRLFHVQTKKEFPDADTKAPNKRFTGYSAVHYRVQLKDRDLSDSDKRYTLAKIEIQVASILMHAWAEVEHDLIYKPLAGELSKDEHAILDQLNGLVISGEIALEMLQRAGEVRVAESGRRFTNHYDLAVHLIRLAAAKIEEPISEAGLGRVDLLFEFIARLGLDTPERLSRYVEALHRNLELRPLAEQIIDALLAEDATRYEVYGSIRAHGRSTFSETTPDGEERYRQVGIFMAHWIELEQLTRELSITRGIHRPTITTSLLLKGLNILPPGMLVEFDQLRRMRNHLVHGIESPTSAELTEASQRLELIKTEIQQRVTESK